MNKRFAACLGAACLLLWGCADTPEVFSSDPEAVPAIAVTDLTETDDLTEEYLLPETVASMPAGTVIDGTRIDPEHFGLYFTSEPISETVFARINGISYQENPNISLNDLRYLRMLHYTPDGGQAAGEMIVNKQIAADVLAIFRELYTMQYPIEKMLLIDEYSGDDEASMADNNTSAFNYRVVAGTSTLSRHAVGMAIDLNPCMNPYITYNADGTENISPENAVAFADRSASFQMKIDTSDAAYKLFTAYGFEWGGSWTTVKDYQHFEIN